MEIISEIMKDDILKYTILIIVMVFVIIIIIFFIQYNIDRIHGKHAKFLWFECNKNEAKSDEANSKKNVVIGKNINTGYNNGKIGDN